MDDDRRKNDESFKLKIVADLTELKTKLQMVETHFDKYDNKLQENALKIELLKSDLSKMLDAQIIKQDNKIDGLQRALIGDLNTKDGGLIGTQKSLSVKVGLIIGGFVVAGNFFMSIAKDVIKKQLNEPIFVGKKRNG